MDNLFKNNSESPLQPSILSLCRKYRPQTFQEVQGQEETVNLLQNFFKTQRHHAVFLFSGIRGTGKTTLARILAAAFTCLTPYIDSAPLPQRPTPSPCGTCESCQAIRQNTHLDIMEIDAASHTGVDNIREILAMSTYSPTLGSYKVFIIDEVHMLSKSACSAMLKTLEETQVHVKFLLATTEPQKLLDTFLSRCLHFMLTPINRSRLQDYLGIIAEKEGIICCPEALRLLAHCSQGSLREGVMLLEKVITATPTNLDEHSVRRVLGLTEPLSLLKLLEALKKESQATLLELAKTMTTCGGDPSLCLEDLLHLIYSLSIIQAAPNTPHHGLFDTHESRKRLEDLCQIYSEAELQRLWCLLLQGLKDVKQAPYPDEAFHMVILRLKYATHLPLPEDLMAERPLPTSDAVSYVASSITTSEAFRSLARFFPGARLDPPPTRKG